MGIVYPNICQNFKCVCIVKIVHSLLSFAVGICEYFALSEMRLTVCKCVCNQRTQRYTLPIRKEYALYSRNQKQFESSAQELKEAQNLEDLSILEKATVIGMTTTGTIKFELPSTLKEKWQSINFGLH
jgi:hypothetical protein